MSTSLRQRLEARIAQVDADIERIARNAQAEIARLREVKATLREAADDLTADREALVAKLLTLGVL